MTIADKIKAEAERFYPVKNETVIVAGQTITHDDNFVPREVFKQAATFGASLNGWVSVKYRPPTKEDADDGGWVEAWDTNFMCSLTVDYTDIVNDIEAYTHWRKIVKP